jgi:histidine ammonia-lyase
MTDHLVTSDQLSIKIAYQIVLEHSKLQLSNLSNQQIQRCRTYLDEKTANPDHSFYGINTGFGVLCHVAIPPADLQDLQRNLLLSHACGMGNEVPPDLVRLMLLLKIQSLSYGYSGVQVATVERLIALFNHDVLPIVYEQGSLGASGDLAPLAHLCLPLIGEGMVNYGGKTQPTAEVLAQLDWQPITLQSKEGLALINGTQFMSSYGVWCVMNAKRLLKTANFIAALALEAYDGVSDAFHARIQSIRGQKGQKKVAKSIRRYLAGSQIAAQSKTQVQDPYSFRCVPQVHGASADAIDYVASIVAREINGVTDNPNVFVKEDQIMSGGNFHGQPLALSLDFLSMALAELGSISERRTYKLLGGKQNLPAMLIENGGLHSGLMIPQYVAAALVSQNKQYCTPASVDSITSSNGQEDHVSMGANAATKCYKVVQNLEKILAIELFTASQALAFRKQQTGLCSSEPIEAMLSAYRQKVPFLTADRFLQPDLTASVLFLQEEIEQFL